MIWSVGKDDKKSPIAWIYQNGQVIEEFEGYGAAQLKVLTGAISDPREMQLFLGQKHDTVWHGITVGILSEGTDDLITNSLRSSVDALFLAPVDEIPVLARHIVRAITSPGEPNAISCCDWNDMRTLITSGTASTGKFGLGRGVGDNAGNDATNEALTQIGPVDGANLICLVTGSAQLRGAQVKEMAGRVRQFVGDRYYYMFNARVDERMPLGQVDVDILAF